jgi:hypothetical protein
MDRSYKSAVVLKLERKDTDQREEFPCPGFINRDPKGTWVRDARNEFGMEGGIWMLDRFVQVLEKSEPSKFERLKVRQRI